MMKKLSLFLLMLSTFFVSCEEKLPEVEDEKPFTGEFYWEDELISFNNSDDNIKTQVIGFGSSNSNENYETEFNEGFKLEMLLGDFLIEEQRSKFSNYLEIEILNNANTYDIKISPFVNVYHFDNLLSPKSIKFYRSQDIYKYDFSKNEVIITYYDKNGEVWTTADFANKFFLPIENMPVNNLSYDDFSFVIQELSSSEVTPYPKQDLSQIGKRVKMLFSCELMNKQGETKKMTFGNINFTFTSHLLN